MPRGDLVGSLEYMVLFALVHLGPGAYGMTVRREVELRTGRNISIGAIYATLERLEGKGYVRSTTGEPTPMRGGRAKRLFQVQTAGERALRATHETLQRMAAGAQRRWRTT